LPSNAAAAVASLVGLLLEPLVCPHPIESGDFSDDEDELGKQIPVPYDLIVDVADDPVEPSEDPLWEILNGVRRLTHALLVRIRATPSPREIFAVLSRVRIPRNVSRGSPRGFFWLGFMVVHSALILMLLLANGGSLRIPMRL
jgi:hypothetical protein